MNELQSSPQSSINSIKEKTVAIIGSGPAGLTSAIYLARANLNPVLFAGTVFGGQLMITTDVDNFPGFPEGIMGPVLMQKMIKQAEKFGAKIQYKDVDKVDFRSSPFKIFSEGAEYNFDGVIVATGAAAKWLNIDSEQRLIGKGVSSCATCDAAFFRGKKVGVVGGGDSAMEEALFLTKFASDVTLIHRQNSFRASKIMQDKVFGNDKIKVIYNSEVTEVLGEEKVEGVRIKNNQSKKEELLTLDGVFIAIGHNPNTQIFKDQLEMNSLGYICVNQGTKTNIEGIFTAGDVDDFKYRQAITAAGEGCKAAIDLEKYLEQ